MFSALVCPYRVTSLFNDAELVNKPPSKVEATAKDVYNTNMVR